MNHQRKEVIGDATLYLGDCLEVMAGMENESVDAVVMSPPYDSIRDYGGGYKFDWDKTIKEIYRIFKKSGILVWNVSDQTVNGSETLTSFKQALWMKECGFKIHDTMIYVKNGVVFPESNRYISAFEYMFIAVKGKLQVFNPLQDRANKYFGTYIHGTKRQKDGSTKPNSGNGKTIPEFGKRFNWWLLHNAWTGETGNHPAPMPYSMAWGHIYSWTKPQSIILDPVMGSGTTGVACYDLGRKFIGIEIEPKYFDIACKRIEQAQKQLRLLI